MKRLLFALAITAAVALSWGASSAMAGGPHGGHGGHGGGHGHGHASHYHGGGHGYHGGHGYYGGRGGYSRGYSSRVIVARPGYYSPFYPGPYGAPAYGRTYYGGGGGGVYLNGRNFSLGVGF